VTEELVPLAFFKNAQNLMKQGSSQVPLSILRLTILKTYFKHRLNTWIPGLKEFRMPSDETTYWCTFHSFPLEGPNYLVAVSGLISPNWNIQTPFSS